MKSLQRIAWVALLSMLMVAFAPSVSRVLAAAEGQPLQVAWCSEGVVHYVELDRGAVGDDDPPPKAMVSADCPYCSMHLAKALPPARAVAAFAAPPWRAMPPRFYASARTSHVWTSTQARAPPSLS